jgi:hypothetical protein
MGNKHPLGQGSVTLKTRLSDRFKTINLCDALHIPHLTMNWMSLGTLQHEGATFYSSKKGLVILLKGEMLLETTPAGTLYYINQIPDKAIL